MGGNAFTSFPAGAGVVGGWVELARTTLGSSNQNITVSSLADKRYYMVLAHAIGATIPQVRLGNSTIDSSANYASRLSNDGGADTTETSVTEMYGSNSTISAGLQVAYFANLSGKEKLMQSWCSTGATLGAANAPSRTETVGKWVNTSNPLDIINWIDVSATNFSTGSEVVVLGWDPADVHTNNFWEELDSTDFSGSADSFDSGTFTAKKYLWVQCYLEGTSSMRPFAIRFNSDTGTNYAFRRSAIGAADGTFTNTTIINGAGGQGVTNLFWNMFIVNNSANEKLCSIHSVSVNAQGAGTAPRRDEIVGKWTNTSSQITSITVLDDDSGKITTGKLRVWGSN